MAYSMSGGIGGRDRNGIKTSLAGTGGAMIAKPTLRLNYASILNHSIETTSIPWEYLGIAGLKQKIVQTARDVDCLWT